MKSKQATPSRNYFIGDFTGSGYESLLYITHGTDLNGDSRESTAVLVDFKQKKLLYNSKCFTVNPGDIISAADWDGDGKTDIYHMTSERTTVYQFDINQGLQRVCSDSYMMSAPLVNGTTLKHNGIVLFGDINGDGKTDILKSPPYNKGGYTNWRIFYSTGKSYNSNLADVSGGFSGYFANPDDICTFNPEYKYFLQDVDGDGLPDLVILNKEGTVYIHKNRKGKFLKEPEIAPEKIDSRSKLLLSRVQETNNLHPIMGVNKAQLYLFKYSTSEKENQLMSNFVNSYSVESKYNYGTLIDKNVCTVGQNDIVSFPYNYFVEDIFVLKNIETSLNNTKISSASYKYNNPVVHRQGLGFRGFEQVTVTDNLRKKSTIQKYNPQMFGVLTSIQTPTNIVKSDYETVFAENKRVQLLLKKEEVQDILKGITTASDFKYDSYGNLINRVVDYGSNIKSETSYQLSNIDNTTTYLLGLLKEEKQVSTRNGASTSDKTVIDYNDNYLPISKKSYYENNQVSEEKYSYDSSYNLEELQTKSYESTDWLVTKYEYDSEGRKIKETDPMGFSTEYSYNDKSLLQSVKNHKGHVISYNYDRWGGNIKTTYADGTTESLNLAWFTDNILTGDTSTNPQQQAQIVLSSKLTQGSTITACEKITLKPGFSFAASSGNVMKLGINNQACIPTPQGGIAKSVTYVITKKSTGKPDTQTFYDALNREIRSGQKSFDGKYLYTDNAYDSLGRVQKTSLPTKYKPVLWNTYNYDEYDRITSLNYASGKKDLYSYKNLKSTSTIDGVESTTEYDSSGETKSITDPAGVITYNLRPDGQPASIVAPGNITTTFQYDKFGRQTAIIDPSAGNKSFGYDTAGNINKETDARGKVTNLKYDKYNRLVSKEIVNEFSTTYKYNADNLIELESSTNGTSKSYTYDNYLRLKTQKESIVDGKWLEQTFGYRSDGNIGSIAYSSQNGSIATENYEYTNGHHTELKLNNSLSVWKLLEENDLGMPTASKTGVIDRKYTYDTFGLPTGRILKNGNNTLQNFGYKFDAPTGNLTWRKDNTRNIQEDFLYDGLNRLTNFNGSTIKYNSLGNITDHSAIGAFTYDKTKPYAIATVAPYANNLYKNNQDITYNALMRPASISENGFKALFSYDQDGNRVKMNLTKDGALQLNRYYIGGLYEIDETLAGNTERLYLGGDAYSAAAVYVKESGSWKVNYVGRDYLGSITHVMDATGVVRQELSYDPWGRLRNPINQALFELDKRMTLVLGDRGYTGHEHLQEFSLINMNARLYDPVVGRFLSPDPYVQAPDFSQNFNRYSYALNNPLRYTDPNGEFFWVPFAIAAIAGGINWYAHGAEFSWNGLAAFGIGAGAGLIGYATGGAAFIAAGGGVAGAGGIMAGIAGGVFGYMGSAPIQNVWNHVVFGDPLMSAGDHAIGMAVSGLTGGFTNGITAKINGRNIWNGNVKPSPLPVTNPVPGKIEPLGKQYVDAQKPKTPNIVARATPEGTTFTIDYDLNYPNPKSYSLDGGKTILSRPEIKGYNLRINNQTDLYHSFPQEFDTKIVRYGNWSNNIRSMKEFGNYGHFYELPGTINNKSGMFQIGINESGIIYHKAFNPIK